MFVLGFLTPPPFSSSASMLLSVIIFFAFFLQLPSGAQLRGLCMSQGLPRFVPPCGIFRRRGHTPRVGGNCLQFSLGPPGQGELLNSRIFSLLPLLPYSSSVACSVNLFVEFAPRFPAEHCSLSASSLGKKRFRNAESTNTRRFLTD